MGRFWILPLVMALALGLAVWALQSPAPEPRTAPAGEFSAMRAMDDVRIMARAPHPVGTEEHARVQAYLLGRLTGLGLEVSTHVGQLSRGSIQRLERWGVEAEHPQAVNLIGVLPGRNRSLPPVVLMSHYDSSAISPGAADDAAGVAASLEAVRAIKARGQPLRDVVVLITDAEELGLDGARAFFSEHPVRDRTDAVINLEARGGGGRALMFQTGRGNAETIAAFARAAREAKGGPTSNSMAVFAYDLMPNDTDFTVPRDRGIGGINLAFIGRPAQYHAAASTPDALDQGSLQHIGGLALAMTDSLARIEASPKVGEDVVYSDILGLGIVSHAQGTGWLLILAAGGLLGFAAWGARHATRLRLVDVGQGVVSALWLLAAGVVMAGAARALAGPVGRVSTEVYYELLGRLPWIEAAVALALLAVGCVMLAGRAVVSRRTMALVLGGTALLAQVVGGGLDLIITGAALLGAGLSFVPLPPVRSRWGGWIGATLLVLALGIVVQMFAPTAAYLMIWPALLSALAAAIAAAVDARLERFWAYLAAMVVAVIAGAVLMTHAHPLFLGVGMDMAWALAILALPIAMLLTPFAPTGRGARVLAAVAAVALIGSAGLTMAGRMAAPDEAAQAAK